MGCEHKRLRTVGDRVFCCECNTELPLEFLTSRNAPVKAENRANKPADKPKPDKASARKRTAKKAV